MRFAAAVLLILIQPAAPPAFVFHHLHRNEWGTPWVTAFYSRLFEPGAVRVSTQFGDEAVEFSGISLIAHRATGGMLRTPNAAWHFGWGPTSFGTSYRVHLAQEVQLNTPIVTAIDAFHLDLNSLDGPAACRWYADILGAVCSIADDWLEGEPTDERRTPAAIAKVGLVAFAFYEVFDDVALGSSRRHLIDHIAFACDDLDAAPAHVGRNLPQLKIEQRAIDGVRTAMFEGPDRIAIELVETSRR